VPSSSHWRTAPLPGSNTILNRIKFLPDQAEAKYNEALAVKGEHVDALQYLGSLEMERAKLAAGINVGTRCVGFGVQGLDM
jgi:hypothetical protein